MSVLARVGLRRTALSADVVGLCLVAGLIGWTLLSAVSVVGRVEAARAEVGLIVVTSAVYAGSRLLSIPFRWLAPLVVVAASIFVAVDAISSTGPPAERVLAYSNARGQLLVQGFAAAAMLGVMTRRRAVWLAAGVLAVVIAGLTFRTGSLAADALLVLPIAGVVIGTTHRHSRPFLLALGILLCVTFASTVALGALNRGSDEGANALIDATLSGRRTALWHDALVLIVEHPLLGVGPQRFRLESPTARSDQDAVWAHNGYLQQGAETGVVGGALLLLTFLWAILRASRPHPDAAGLVGASAVCALGIHACVDYMLHFAALPIAAAALLGSAVTPPATEPDEAR